MTTLPVGWTPTAINQLIVLNPKTEAPDDATAAFSPMQSLGKSYREPVAFEGRRWGEIKKAYTHFADGDVLLAKITPCFENGKAGIARDLPNGIGAGSSEFFVCRSKSRVIDPRYLLAWVSTESFRARGAVNMTGSVGHKRVPKDFLVNDVIPLAPFAEQQRIADKLDAVLARVDACRERLANVAPLLKRFRQSVLSSAMQGRLTEEWRRERGISLDLQKVLLGEDVIALPASWDVQSLSSVIDPSRPLCYGVVQPGEAREGGVALIRVQDMDRSTVLLNELRTISPEIDAEYKRSRVKAGDVLISVVGTIGRTAIVPATFEGNIARAIARIAVRKTVNPMWVHAWLSSATVQWWLASSSREVARKTLNLSELAALKVGLPMPEEQLEIVRRVTALLAVADRLEARLAQAQVATDRLTPALLAKAFRGELVPQDPSDEPAAELLKRIAAPEEKTKKNARLAAS